MNALNSEGVNTDWTHFRHMKDRNLKHFPPWQLPRCQKLTWSSALSTILQQEIQSYLPTVYM